MKPDFMDRDVPNEYYDERHEYYSAGYDEGYSGV